MKNTEGAGEAGCFLTEREDWPERLRESAGQLEGYMSEIRRKLHRWPEPAFQEFRTSETVAAALKDCGLHPVTGVGGTGVYADCAGGLPGPVIALRADMDALPVPEETGLAYASERPGFMHACGHDLHTAILLGTARILSGCRPKLAGTVRFLFQPAEETNAGAKAMIDAGVLDGVEEIYALHNDPGLPAGIAAVRAGPMMGSVDRIELTVEGKGGHGAIPELCSDPVVASSAIVMALQTAVSREISPFEPAVVTIGSIRAGDAGNVIPHRAELTGTVRTFSAAVQEAMPGRLQRLAERTAAAYGCRAELRYISQTPVLISDPGCAGHVREAVSRVLGSGSLTEAAPTMAGEDFSFYLTRIPGCLFWLGSGNPGGGEGFGLHHPRYSPDEACMVNGAAVMSAAALLRLGWK